MNIRAVQNGFVGEVTGIDICKPLTGADVAAIEQGMDDYAVLTFPDQPLTDEQQVTFTANFGELEITLAGQMAKPEERRFQQLELGDISNFNGADTTRLRARDDKRRMPLWRTGCGTPDASFRAIGAGYTRCCMPVSFRKRPIRSSPTCVPPMTRSAPLNRRKPRIWSANIRSFSHANKSALAITTRAMRNI